MFYSWFFESGYVWKDGLQSAVRGAYLQNKLPFEVCNEWLSDCEELFISLKMPVDTVKELFFLQTIMDSKKKQKHGTTPLE